MLDDRVEYYFFLSYARGEDGPVIQQFFQDLSSEVRSHAGLRADAEVGFFDVHSIELGAAWSNRLMSALAGCRSFVALCSPRYFLSEFCGKEWTVFANRLQEYERGNGVQPPALLPLRWVDSRRTPDAVAERQYHNDHLPDDYPRTGLRQLMRLQRHRDSYLEFVSELARQIVETSEAHPIPRMRGLPDFTRVANAFKHNAAGADRADDERSDYVHFVVAAPSRAELDSDEQLNNRTRRDCYGDRPQEWAPYHPALSAPLAQYAVDIAEQRSFGSVVTDVSRLVNRVELARANNQIVILLIDVWATRLDRHREALVECNERDQSAEAPMTAVMVPSSHDDNETQANWPQFEHAVRDIFPRRAANGDVMFRPSILTHQAFGADLQVVLEVARNRIFVGGQVRRQVTDASTSLPILQGP